MRVRCPLLLSAALLATAAPRHVHAAPNALSVPAPDLLVSSHFALYATTDDGHVLFARDEHAHGHGKPLEEVNETQVLQGHLPTPPSYGTHDFEDPHVTHKHPYLMGLHVLLMSSAFFVALPVDIALRSVNHGLHVVSVTAFYGTVVLGLACSALYRKLTPNMYEHAKHGPQGYFVLFFAGSLTTIDAFATLTRAFRFVKAVRRKEISFSIKAFWKTVVLNKENELLNVDAKGNAHEYTGLVVEEPEDLEMDIHELKAAGTVDHIDIEPEHTDVDLQSPLSEEDSTECWANNVRSMHRQHRDRSSQWRQSVASDGTLFHPHPGHSGSQHSDETLHELPSHVREVKLPLVQRVGIGAFAAAERVLVFLGYMQVLTGIVTYTGVCRNSYVNGCLAHLIKGGIFWCYGLATFARFLGSFSELGWAWNRAPRSDKYPTAEFVESLIIFLYGISNTWMERFGAQPGAPYTTKEVQHISIAVMFWFAGLVGMGIESKTIRRWLSVPAASLASSSIRDIPTPPPSYRGSFNPFPALVIGVTGLAMAAHAQAYVFQVQVHSLWGQLLATFAGLRCITYFFLWISPPSSVLPSRPPTEALASFFLACGGLVFQFSTEELTLAAMRRGHDDVMMFLNVAVAMTCLAFCWVLGVVTFKAWLKTRQVASVTAGRAPATA